MPAARYKARASVAKLTQVPSKFLITSEEGAIAIPGLNFIFLLTQSRISKPFFPRIFLRSDDLVDHTRDKCIIFVDKVTGLLEIVLYCGWQVFLKSSDSGSINPQHHVVFCPFNYVLIGSGEIGESSLGGQLLYLYHHCLHLPGLG